MDAGLSFSESSFCASLIFWLNVCECACARFFSLSTSTFHFLSQSYFSFRGLHNNVCVHFIFSSPFDLFEVAIAILFLPFVSPPPLLLLNLSKSKANQIRNLDTNTFAHLTLLSCCACGVLRVCVFVRNFKFKFESYDRSHQRTHRFSSSSDVFFPLCRVRVCVCELCVSQRSLSSRF